MDGVEGASRFAIGTLTKSVVSEALEIESFFELEVGKILAYIHRINLWDESICSRDPVWPYQDPSIYSTGKHLADEMSSSSAGLNGIICMSFSYIFVGCSSPWVLESPSIPHENSSSSQPTPR